MSDFISGQPAGTPEREPSLWGGGTPPPVLLAALAAAALIAITLIAFLIGSGSGNDGQLGTPRAAVAGDDGDDRVRLTITIDGGGDGRVQIVPPGIACSSSCEREYTPGTRLTITASPSQGSTFDGWADACDGSGGCSVVMRRERTLAATFARSLGVEDCDGDVGPDGICEADDSTAPDVPPPPASDCDDGRDNDGDGLIDTAQDPGCEQDGSEEDAVEPADPSAPPPPAGTPPPPPPPSTTTPRRAPPAAPANDCADGRDNDGDGLTDSAQDPNCTNGRTEAG